jgi:hypothetical protein
MEAIPSFELIQSNTDGLIVKVLSEDFELLKSVCAEWETRTQFNLDVEDIIEIWQKDVNNYVFTYYDKGEFKIERKGGYVKPTNELDNDLPIVSRAVVDYMVYGVPVEKTVMESNSLIDFQKIVKTSSKYKSAWHNGAFLQNKVNRVFASRFNEGYIGKIKEGSETIEKFANTPENCFIDNSDITGKGCPVKLDRNYYIELAKKRLIDFGAM